MAEEPMPDEDQLLESLSATAFFSARQSTAAAKEAEAAAKENEKERKQLAREMEKDRAAEYKRTEAARKQAEKAAKKPNALARAPKADGDDTDSIYGDEATPIVGAKHRELLTKFRQYKLLFKDNAQIKAFKVRKNASVDDLKAALDEMDSIVGTSSVDDFLTDAILTTIKMVEGISARSTSYNISGLSDILKTNKEFCNLTKQCLIKYGVYASVPPETQLIFIIITSAYICSAKNSRKGAINNYLDEPIKTD